jgi:hypothetical protein
MNFQNQNNRDYTQVLTKNIVNDNYSNYGLIPNSVGKTQYNAQDFNVSPETLNKTNEGVFFQTAAGKKTKKSKYVNEQNGGDSSFNTTGMINRFYDANAQIDESCTYGQNQNMNVGHYDLEPHGPICSKGGAKKKTTPKKKKTTPNKKKKTPKKKTTPKKKKTTPKKKKTTSKKKKSTPKKKTTPKKKIMKGGKISDGVTEPLKLGVNTWESLNSFVHNLEKKMTNFYDDMSSKNIPNYNSSQSIPISSEYDSTIQSGGEEKKLVNYFKNLNTAMSNFQKDIQLMNSNNQKGGMNYINNNNMDSPTTPNHPIQEGKIQEPSGIDSYSSQNYEIKSGGSKKKTTPKEKKKTPKKKITTNKKKTTPKKRSLKKKIIGNKTKKIETKKPIKKKTTPKKRSLKKKNNR